MHIPTALRKALSLCGIAFNVDCLAPDIRPKSTIQAAKPAGSGTAAA